MKDQISELNMHYLREYTDAYNTSIDLREKILIFISSIFIIIINIILAFGAPQFIPLLKASLFFFMITVVSIVMSYKYTIKMCNGELMYIQKAFLSGIEYEPSEFASMYSHKLNACNYIGQVTFYLSLFLFFIYIVR